MIANLMSDVSQLCRRFRHQLLCFVQPHLPQIIHCTDAKRLFIKIDEIFGAYLRDSGQLLDRQILRIMFFEIGFCKLYRIFGIVADEVLVLENMQKQFREGELSLKAAKAILLLPVAQYGMTKDSKLPCELDRNLANEGFQLFSLFLPMILNRSQR